MRWDSLRLWYGVRNTRESFEESEQVVATEVTTELERRKKLAYGRCGIYSVVHGDRKCCDPTPGLWTPAPNVPVTPQTSSKSPAITIVELSSADCAGIARDVWRGSSKTMRLLNSALRYSRWPYFCDSTFRTLKWFERIWLSLKGRDEIGFNNRRWEGLAVTEYGISDVAWLSQVAGMFGFREHASQLLAVTIARLLVDVDQPRNLVQEDHDVLSNRSLTELEVRSELW